MLDANNTYFSKLAGKDGETSGTYKALWAFRNSIVRGTDELEASEYIWKNEVKDFVEALRKAGIKTFVVTTNSTSLLDAYPRSCCLCIDTWCRQLGCCQPFLRLLPP